MPYFKISTALVLTFAAMSTNSPVLAQSSSCNWEGDWETSRGGLNLTADNEFYTGYSDEFGSVTGLGYVDNTKCELYGVFRNLVTSKQGEFKLKQNGTTFSGQWNDVKGRAWAHSWTGSRNGENAAEVSGASPNNSFSGMIQGQILSEQTMQQGQIVVAQNPMLDVINSQDDNDEPTDDEVEKLEATLAALEEKKKETKVAAHVAKLKAIKKGRWNVELEAICAWRTDERDQLTREYTEDYYGIGWIRARIINKKTNKQINLAPIGGFPNVNGDKERVWEVKPNASHHFSVTEGDCRTLRDNFTYEVDFVKYGYNSLVDFLDESRNRIDVMFKLTEHDAISADDYLGTKRTATSFKQAQFCKICGNYGEVPKFRRGQGMLNGFVNDGTEVSVAYGISPDYDLRQAYYNRPNGYSLHSDVLVPHFYNKK